MNKFKVPWFSKQDIERQVDKVINFFDSSILSQPKFTPIAHFLFHLQEMKEVLIDITQELGYTNKGNKILGKFIINPHIILIDKDIVDTERQNFAMAHEFGHFVLHRTLKIPLEEYRHFIDTEVDYKTGKKKLVTTRDRIEWQANYFASALLMPQKTILNAVINIQREMDIYRNLVFCPRFSFSLK